MSGFCTTSGKMGVARVAALVAVLVSMSSAETLAVDSMGVFLEWCYNASLNIFYYHDVKLEIDLVFNESTVQALPIGFSQSSMPFSYSGVFDGQNHAIKNISIESKVPSLFGSINSATIRNLVIDSTCTFTSSSLGIVTSYARVVAENIHTHAEIHSQSEYTGGLFSNVLGNAAIINCSNSGPITIQSEYAFAGGLVGSCGSPPSRTREMISYDKCNITGSNNSGNITAIGVLTIVGGLVGRADSSTIKGSQNTGHVMTNNDDGGNAYIGGLIGSADMYVNVISCENKGSVTSECNNSQSTSCWSNLGGLAGGAYDGSIFWSCLNSGAVKTTNAYYANIGGLCGESTSEISAYNCTNNGVIDVQAQDCLVGGIFGQTVNELMNCINNNTVTAQCNTTTSTASGILGDGYDASIMDSINRGSVKLSGQGTAAGVADCVYNTLNVVNMGGVEGPEKMVATISNCTGNCSNLFVLDGVCTDCDAGVSSTTISRSTQDGSLIISDTNELVADVMNKDTTSSPFPIAWKDDLSFVTLWGVYFGPPANVSAIVEAGQTLDVAVASVESANLTKYHFMEVKLTSQGWNDWTKELELDTKVWQPMLCALAYKAIDSTNESRSWYFSPGELLSSNSDLMSLVNSTDSVECLDADGKVFDMDGSVTSDLTLVFTNNTHNVTLELDWTILGNSTSESAIKKQLSVILGDENLVQNVVVVTNDAGIATSVIVDVSGLQAAQALAEFVSDLDQDNGCAYGVLCRTVGTKVDQVPVEPMPSRASTAFNFMTVLLLLLVCCVYTQQHRI